MSDHVSELIPWYLNGRLSPEDNARVAEHVHRCQRCNGELRLQQHVHDAITASAKVEIAPQPSFNKLWERISAEEDAVTFQSSPVIPKTSTVRQAIQWLRSHWTPLFLVTQTAVIAVLAGMLTVQHLNIKEDAAYRTVTSNAPLPGVVIHVVFDDATRLGDIKDILLRSNLQVAAGPTTAGVYSLSPAGARGDFNAQEIVHALRDDPRVRFAELSHE